MAQAEFGGRPRLVDRLFGKSKEALTPEQAWLQTFEAKREGFTVRRLEKGKTNISLQEYNGARVAHLDEGNKDFGRIAVVIDAERNAFVVRAVPTEGDDITPAGHRWDVVAANPQQVARYLKNTEKDIRDAKVFKQNEEGSMDPKKIKSWGGQIPENLEIFDAIRAARARHQ